MAFLPQNQNQQQQQGQQQDDEIPVIPSLQGTSGPSGSQSGGTGSTNTASPGAAPSSPWQNVTSYLQANAGQANNVANTVAGNLNNQYNAANQGIQQANQNYGQQIESARVPQNADLTSQAASHPGQFAQDPNNVAAFQKMYNATYGGPQDFSHSQDYSNLQGQVQKGQQQAGLVNQGTPGLMTLIQQAESQGGHSPTQGVTALDTLLTQEDPNNFAMLQNAAKPFAGLTDYLSQTQTGLDTAAQNAAQEATATQAATQGQFIGPGGVVPTFQNNLNQNLQNASKQVTDYNNNLGDIMGRFNSGQGLTPEQLSSVDPGGALQQLIHPGQNNGIFDSIMSNGLLPIGSNYLAQFYNAPNQATQPGIENVMTQEQQADARALNQLVGQDAIGVPDMLGKQFTAPAGMGSFQDHNALQSLYDQLKTAGQPGGSLSQMFGGQQDAYLADTQLLGSLLGIPNVNYPNPQPLPPTTPYIAPPDPLHPLPTDPGNPGTGWLGFV